MIRRQWIAFLGILVATSALSHTIYAGGAPLCVGADCEHQARLAILADEDVKALSLATFGCTAGDHGSCFLASALTDSRLWGYSVPKDDRASEKFSAQGRQLVKEGCDRGELKLCMAAKLSFDAGLKAYARACNTGIEGGCTNLEAATRKCFSLSPFGDECSEEQQKQSVAALISVKCPLVSSEQCLFERGCKNGNSHACTLRGDLESKTHKAEAWYRKSCAAGFEQGCQRYGQKLLSRGKSKPAFKIFTKLATTSLNRSTRNSAATLAIAALFADDSKAAIDRAASLCENRGECLASAANSLRYGYLRLSPNASLSQSLIELACAHGHKKSCIATSHR